MRPAQHLLNMASPWSNALSKTVARPQRVLVVPDVEFTGDRQNLGQFPDDLFFVLGRVRDEDRRACWTPWQLQYPLLQIVSASLLSESMRRASMRGIRDTRRFGKAGRAHRGNLGLSFVRVLCAETRPRSITPLGRRRRDPRRATTAETVPATSSSTHSPPASSTPHATAPQCSTLGSSRPTAPPPTATRWPALLRDRNTSCPRSHRAYPAPTRSSTTTPDSSPTATPPSETDGIGRRIRDYDAARAELDIVRVQRPGRIRARDRRTAHRRTWRAPPRSAPAHCGARRNRTPRGTGLARPATGHAR